MTNADVFVVDDDPSVRRALDRLLRSAGYCTRTFGSANDVLAAVRAVSPACIIIDVRMPMCDGFELFEWLRTVDPSVAVVFITGHGDIAMAVRAMKAGAVDFLSKPFDDQALLEAVAQAVARRSGGTLARNDSARSEVND